MNKQSIIVQIQCDDNGDTKVLFELYNDGIAQESHSRLFPNARDVHAEIHKWTIQKFHDCIHEVIPD